VADLGLQCCILHIVHQVLNFPIGILGILKKKITTRMTELDRTYLHAYKNVHAFDSEKGKKQKGVMRNSPHSRIEK
jgi:hypothetical protein